MVLCSPPLSVQIDTSWYKKCHLTNRNAICILHRSDCAWLCCSLSQLKTWNVQHFFNNMIGKFCWKSWKTHDLKKQNFLLETLNFLLKTQNILFMNHIEIYGYFMLANFMLLSDGKNPWQMKPLHKSSTNHFINLINFTLIFNSWTNHALIL